MDHRKRPEGNIDSEVEKVKDLIAEIVVPESRKDINIIPDHITVLHGTKSKKQLTKKKPKKKSILLTRKECSNLGLYNIPTKSLKYNDVLPLHELWKGYVREHLCLQDDNSVPDLTDPKYDAFSKLLVKTDLHGAFISVLRSKCPNFVGLSGIVILDTKNTLKLVGKDNKTRTIPKQDCVFTIQLENFVFTIFGKHLAVRSAERSVKKVKNFIDPIL